MAILQLDDLEVGMFITVYSLKENIQNNIQQQVPEMDMFSLLIPPKEVNQRYSNLKGLLMRVEAIDLPYVIVTGYELKDNVINKKMQSSTTLFIDTREINLMKLNEKFVLAYLGEERFNQL